MNAINQIVEDLNKIFVDLDADVLENSKKWALNRKEAIVTFKKSDEYQALRKDTWKLYDKLFEIAGGKTWYNVLNGNGQKQIEAFVEKNCKASATNRNAIIASKLEKAEVTEIIETTYTRSSDGFNGVFVVNTNKGRKVVTVDTIIAGGYNIQCRHLRVLVKVK